MVKQDQNHSQSSEQKRKQQANPQCSHKEKARENQRHQTGQGFMQGSHSQQTKKPLKNQNSSKSNDFDRNEGEEHSQKS